MWNKDCFSKVVGEIASLVCIDRATKMWEYARLQVHLLKNCNARLAKDMRINGQIVSVCIEEEYSCVSGSQRRCLCDHFASSDSVTS